MSTNEKLFELSAIESALNLIIYATSSDGVTDGKISLTDIKNLFAATAAEIKTSYESNADTNAFDDVALAKLAGVDPGATANDTDAFLVDRENHTGTQTAATISDFSESAAAGTDNNQTGTAYTLVLTDRNNVSVTMDSTAANTVTIPTDAFVAFPTGTKIPIAQFGAGLTTIEGDVGVIVNGVSAGAKELGGQYTGALLWKVAANTWIIL